MLPALRPAPLRTRRKPAHVWDGGFGSLFAKAPSCLLSAEPRLVVAEQDQHVAGLAAAEEMPVVVDVVGRQQGRDLGRREGPILGKLDGRDLAFASPDPPAAIRPEPDDR